MPYPLANERHDRPGDIVRLLDSAGTLAVCYALKDSRTCYLPLRGDDPREAAEAARREAARLTATPVRAAGPPSLAALTQTRLHKPPAREVLRDSLLSYFQPDGGAMLCRPFGEKYFPRGTAFLAGYASIFNLGTNAREDGAAVLFRRGAFADVLASGANVQAFAEHDESTAAIASTARGNLALVEDQHGLAVFAPVENRFGEIVADAICAGKIGSMSLKFGGNPPPVVNGVRAFDKVTTLGEVSFLKSGANPGACCFAFFRRKSAMSGNNAASFQSLFHSERY